MFSLGLQEKFAWFRTTWKLESMIWNGASIGITNILRKHWTMIVSFN